ncbi:MAG: prepilin-type N-terminal cleavage/methylation domain-containing protein [Phycisphaerales bacterium]|nr:prepilin-type N-terminal cleavage/methylation domain-containing protein [Phycisphaerales bacterium]
MNTGTSQARGFSLVELLMAIFILGIGIISIASLFPAGIAQQRAALDDQAGPLVARNAISLLRTRIPRESFGHVEIDASGPGASWAGWDIRPGDWPWLRPSLVTGTSSNGPGLGAIDIFDTADEYLSGVSTTGEKNRSDLGDLWITAGLTSRDGIPYKGHQNDNPGVEDMTDRVATPLVVIEQAERQYPRNDGSGRVPRYYWDCMFRRTGGKVYAAIFVYRVNNFEGDPTPWVCQPNEAGQLQTPWLLDLESNDNQYEPWRIGQGRGDFADRDQWVLPNADAEDTFDPMELDDCWQCPGQWLVDQNGFINKVAVGRVRKDDPTTHVELARPVSELTEDSMQIPERDNAEFGFTTDNRVPNTGSLILPGLNGMPGQQAGARTDSDFFYEAGMLVRNRNGGPDKLTGGPVVSRLWYMPGMVKNDAGGEWNLTPVYVLVEQF